MKQAENAAVVNFKAQVDRMAEFLVAAGYDIKRTHLMEASARFAGARDWRTLRTELAGAEQPKKEPKVAVPDLKGKSVRVYMAPYSTFELGEAPSLCSFVIDQQWVNNVYALREQVRKTPKISEISGGFSDVDWMDQFSEYTFSSQHIVVDEDDFWYSAREKYAEYDVETSMLCIDNTMAAVMKAIDEGRSELFVFLDNTEDSVELLMDTLEREPGHPDYVNPDEYVNPVSFQRTPFRLRDTK